MDATLATVAQRGHAAATTTEICRCAGISQGALFKHFPSKAALLAAAVEDLFPRLLDGVAEAAPHLPADAPERTAAVADLLLAQYERPDLLAAVELYGAARHDPALAAALAAVEPPHRARLLATAARLLPDHARHHDFEAVVDLLVDAVQGAVTGRFVVLAPAQRAAAVRSLRTTARALLDQLAPDP